MFRLFFLGQIGKAGLGFHEPAHERGGMGFHQGGKQRLLAGKIAVKRPCGHACVLDNLPQRSAEEPFLRKLLQCGLLDPLHRRR